MQWLAQQQVKTIIDLQMDDESRDVPTGVRYVPIRAPMWHCDQVDVAAVIKAIDESPKPVFIHCLVGRDRTGLAVAAWQMSHGMSAEEAIAQMERFGSNPYFSDSIKRRIRELEQEQQRTRADKSAATAR
jgi:protein-tyrosine phosphatase